MNLLEKIPEDDKDRIKMAVMPDDLRNAISRLKGEKTGPDLTPPEILARIFPVSTEIAREDAEKEAARKKAEAEALKNPQSGRFIPGKGVFVGQWAPKDRDNHSLGKIFNIFAAPYDLGFDANGQGKRLIVKYNEAVRHIAQIRNLLGHDGSAYENDIALYKALKDESYNGEWFIPTHEILKGKDLDGKKTQIDNLHGNRNSGAFDETFKYSIYWSCTEKENFLGEYVGIWAAQFSIGDDLWYGKDSQSWAVRPVRAELRSPA